MFLRKYWNGFGARDRAVDRVLDYTPEGRRFETRWGELFFSIYVILPTSLGFVIYSVCNINEYQKQKYNVSAEQYTADA
jgi:hypothetical protein